MTSEKDNGFIEEAAEQPLLSAAEIDKIKKQARAEIMDAKKEDLKKALLAEEKKRLRLEEGLTTGNSFADEIVNVTIDLAPYAPNVLVNGVPYWHGRSYPVPRHVASSLQETMFNTWKHQSEIDGKGLREFYAKQHVADLYKVGTPPRHSFSAKGM